MDKIIYRRNHLKQIPSDPVRDDYVFDIHALSGQRVEEIPGRRESLPEFLKYVKDLCDEYEYNLEIHEVDSGVVLQLSIDIGQYTDGNLNRLIGITDDIEIASGIIDRDITFYLRYCVQAYYRDGDRVFPPILGQWSPPRRAT